MAGKKSQKISIRKSGGFKGLFSARRRQSLIGAALVVLIFSVVGFHYLNPSHANGVWNFWGSRSGNLWTSPDYCTSFGTPCGTDPYTLPAGNWAVSCQARTFWWKNFGGYSNDWWVRLSTGQGKYSGLWINEVFLSAGTSGPGGSAPGIRMCTNS